MKPYALRHLALTALLLLMPTLALAEEFDTGDTAWMLTSAALVLLMIPGLALFYGGMSRAKNVLSTFMLSLVAMGIVGVQWVDLRLLPRFRR